MLLQHKPVPGYWYTNIAGQLIQVRAVLYGSGERCRIMLEYINGKRECVYMAGWSAMDLVLHSPGRELRNRARDL